MEVMEQGTERNDNNSLLIDIFLNPAKKENVGKIEEIMKNQTKSVFPASSLSTHYPNLFRLMQHSVLPCLSNPGVSAGFLLKKCSWNGEEVSCSKLFRTVPTDSGMCCGFNVNSALKKSEFSHLVEKMQLEEIQDTKTLDTSFAKAGVSSGLKLVLDQHSNLVTSGSVFTDNRAFKILIADPSQFPALRSEHLIFKPGHEHFISVSPTSVVSNPSIQSISPQKRGCLFENENNLRSFDLYSHSR